MSRFSKTQTIAFSGLFIALAAVLSFFSVPISSILEIRFAIIPIAICGYMLGPVATGIVGGAADVVGYLVKPTGPFFPGFTISNIISGVIFGLMLHNKKVTLWRTLLATIIQSFAVGILLNSLWLSILYGNAFPVVLATRIVKELIMIPINTAIFMAILVPLSKSRIIPTGKKLAKSEAK